MCRAGHVAPSALRHLGLPPQLPIVGTLADTRAAYVTHRLRPLRNLYRGPPSAPSTAGVQYAITAFASGASCSSGDFWAWGVDTSDPYAGRIGIRQLRRGLQLDHGRYRGPGVQDLRQPVGPSGAGGIHGLAVSPR